MWWSSVPRCSGVGERGLRSQCWWSGRRVDRVFDENVFRVCIQFGLGEDGPAALPPAAAVCAAVAGGVPSAPAPGQHRFALDAVAVLTSRKVAAWCGFVGAAFDQFFALKPSGGRFGIT